MITLDGAMGEGGGQVVRTSLALAMITQTPLTLIHIRAGRRKPGLLRQHLTGLRASAAICGAEVSGDVLGSEGFTFVPGPVRGGRYRFAVGTAGSANLVLQTVLPALLHADGPTTLSIEGGTHNDKSPSTHNLQQAFLPLANRCGGSTTLTLERWGFYPAGGGELRADISPAPPQGRLRLHERGDVRLTATAVVCNIPRNIAARELEVLSTRLELAGTEVIEARGPGPGNVMWVTVEMAGTTEIFTAFGSKGVRAERLAKALAKEVEAFLQHDVPVGAHLADQLLIPMALAGSGSFRTVPPSLHTRTNIEVIERFLPVRFTTETSTGDSWKIAVQPR